MNHVDSTATLKPDASLDLRGTPCPINFVRTKLQLEKMPVGAVLEVWLDGGEPVEQVPDSLRMEGHVIESLRDCAGYFALQVRRAS
ncbi:sulfurtransferase TusA family protein [Nodosilinea sp. P-1105]|uniref:sulfurtransferase TusA family protein n=1 Tax=Nodosilinea sp. P-1105 TaxID=2546229 RepID=UPI00146F8AB7|nr:sulfurtransferase TusA family protein [Nodosilinea sp. P-1105]NMF84831.1 sulfurtransferase TusA family protein [Nodosilinea sp. P-1105]